MESIDCIRTWFRSLVIHHNRVTNPLMADNWLDRSSLHMAAFHGRLQQILDLLAHGVDVNTVTLDNVSALHEACLGGHYDCAKLLLDNGADPDGVTLDGGTPLFYACSGGNAACVNLILERSSSPHVDSDLASPIHEAAKKNHKRCLEVLLTWGAQIDVELPLVGTPLYAACMSRAFHCVEVLLQAGADVRLGCGRDSPLHAAVRSGASEIIDLLLDFGADECRRNDDGVTPLGLSEENSTVRAALQGRDICSLSQLCRVAVRRSVGARNLHQISDLVLPRVLKHYLLYQ